MGGEGHRCIDRVSWRQSGVTPSPSLTRPERCVSEPCRAVRGRRSPHNGRPSGTRRWAGRCTLCSSCLWKALGPLLLTSSGETNSDSGYRLGRVLLFTKWVKRWFNNWFQCLNFFFGLFSINTHIYKYIDINTYIHVVNIIRYLQ